MNKCVFAILFSVFTLVAPMFAQVQKYKVTDLDIKTMNGGKAWFVRLKSDTTLVLNEAVSITSSVNNKVQSGKLLNGFFDGYWQEYKDSKLLTYIHFKNGIANGEAIFYRENGNIESIIDMKDGNIEGRNNRYYENGNLKFETRVENGQINGIQRLYKEDGTLQSETNFVNGNMEGPAFFLSDEGDEHFKIKTNYKQNEFHGAYIETYMNGMTKTEGQYDKGNKVGKWVFRTRDGTHTKTETYDNKGELGAS